MKIKNIIASLTIIGIMFAGTAFAMPTNSDPNTDSAQTIESLSPKQLEEWKDLHENHIKKTRNIRSELQAKRMELRALRNNTKVTPDYINELTKDIVALENRVEDMNKDFFETSEKKFDLDFSSMMHGHGGMHHGMHGGMHNSHEMMCGNTQQQNQQRQDAGSDTTKHKM